MSEITESDYRAIAGGTDALQDHIHDLMGRLAGPEDQAWRELHELLRMVNIVFSVADRYAARAELPPGPVDYYPAPDLVADLESLASLWHKSATVTNGRYGSRDAGYDEALKLCARQLRAALGRARA